MPSPDLRSYVDLTVYDRDAQDVFDAAMTLAAERFPDWVAREGNTEVVLLEALALEVAEAIFATNRIPGAVVEAMLQLWEVERDLGTAPTATATFALADNLGHTIPLGTQVRLAVGDDPEAWRTFTLDADLVVAAGATTGTGAITATAVGSHLNATPAGTALELLDSITFVEAVTLASAVSAGADEETPEAWLVRGALRFQRLSDALVLPHHFTAATLETFPTVRRATTVDNWDPDSGNDPGDDLGHVTVLVAGAAGAVVSTPTKESIDTYLEDRALAMLDVHVDDPVIVAVNVTVTVRRFTGYPAATVQAAVQAALTVYLSPDTWVFGADVFRNELIALIDGVEGVDLVVDLVAPAVDVTVSDTALVVAGALAVTVNDP